MIAMWPFKQKALRADQVPIDGPWSVSEGQYNGRVMIVRSNTGYREAGSVPRYEHQVGIAVPLRQAEPTGLPSPTEDALLGEVENTICGSLEQEAESLLVAVITTGGMREFVFYTRGPENVKRRFEQLRNQITSHKIQLMIKSDRTWQTYAELA
jgi:hypothetical protein